MRKDSSFAFRTAAAALALLLCLLVFRIGSQRSLYADEYSTVAIVSSPGLADVVKLVRTAETKPCLHFLYSRLVWRFRPATPEGTQLLLRLSSLPFLLAMLFLLLWAGRDTLSSPLLVFSWPVLVLGGMFFLEWTTQFRQYGMFAASSTIAWWTGWRYYDSGAPLDRFCWIISAALSLHSHYFALFPLLSQVALLLHRSLRDRNRSIFRRLTADLVIIGLLFLPEFPSLLYLLKHPPSAMKWNRPFDFVSLVLLLVRFHTNVPHLYIVLPILLIIPPLVLSSLLRIFGAERDALTYTSGYFILSLAQVVVLGILKPYSFHPRYLLFLFAPYTLLALASLDHGKAFTRRLLLFSMLALTLLPTSRMLFLTAPWHSWLIDTLQKEGGCEQDVFVFGDVHLKVWDYLILDDFYGVLPKNSVIFRPGGASVPYWEGGKFIDGRHVVDSLQGILSSVKKTGRIWYFAGEARSCAEASSALGPEWRLKHSFIFGSFDVMDRRALFLFERSG